MAAVEKQSIVELVEEFRSSGYGGRDPLYASVPVPLGTCATAMRQLEVMATHVASAWLDGDLSDEEFLRFVKDSLLSDISALANIIENAFKTTPRLRFAAAWRGAARLIQEFSVARSDTVNIAQLVVSFLIAAMVLRQLAEFEIAADRGDEKFHSNSSNVASPFFDRCIRVIGWRPFGAGEGVPLAHLEKQLESLTREAFQMVGEAAHQRSA